MARRSQCIFWTLVCNTFSDCKTILQRFSTKMVSKSTMSYNGHQIFGLAKLNLKDIYYVGSFWQIGYGRIILNLIMFSACISFISKIDRKKKHNAGRNCRNINHGSNQQFIQWICDLWNFSFHRNPQLMLLKYPDMASFLLFLPQTLATLWSLEVKRTDL